VAPDEVIAPSEVSLGDMPVPYRHGWAEFVVGQLAGAMAPAGREALAGAVVEIHASDQHVDALRPAVERAGATLVDPVAAHSLSETLTWYDAHHPDGVGLTDLQRSDSRTQSPSRRRSTRSTRATTSSSARPNRRPRRRGEIARTSSHLA